MTTSISESATTILVSCKQTRFHIERPNYRELDIDGLNITVTSADAPVSSSAKGKSKAKARAEGLEILCDAKLRLKEGSRYALVGRNGSGKSTLLKAIARKLIPGIPEETRICILQQTDVPDAPADNGTSSPPSESKGAGGRSVLEEVIETASAKSEVEQEIRVLSAAVNSVGPFAPVQALRQLRHARLLKRHFQLDKDARLRSGARGMQARKALVAFEKHVAESYAKLEQPTESISAETLQSETQEAVDLLADLQLQADPARVSEIESRARRILAGLGFSEKQAAKPVASLSGGWRMRTALASALLQDCDILILDEPTNFLDMLGIVWLQRHLVSLSADGENDCDNIASLSAAAPATPSSRPPTLILVSHDRAFTALCTDLLILRDKQITPFHGDIVTYESSQAERKLYLTKMKEAKDKQKAHIQKSIAGAIRQGKANDDENKLRQAKSRQKKLDDRWGLEVSAKGGRFKLNRDLGGFHLTRRAEIEIPQGERPVTFLLPEPPDLRFPGPLISLEKVAFRYPPAAARAGTAKPPAARPVLRDVSLTVHEGDRVGILGLNGAGKSTLISLLVEASRPTAGTIASHPRLRLGYFSQDAVSVLQTEGAADPSLTALSLMLRVVGADGGGGGNREDGGLDEGQVRALLGTLGLPGRTASDVPVRKLSGGQLVRLELARVLWRRPQCLVLDEVTTHLDYETVAALRATLRDWGGAVILVSHDRWFVRGVVEGEREEDEEGDDSDLDGGAGQEEKLRRRDVYRLQAGSLIALPGGVGEFEALMEKRVKNLEA